MQNTALIGIAGVHYVVSELSRRGLVALPTVKNTAAYDIVAINQAGTEHANIQVKASSKRVGFFPMPHPEKIRSGRNDFYVLVRWIEKEEKYDGFLLTGQEALTAVQWSVEYQTASLKRGTLKKVFPCIYVDTKNAEAAEVWRKAWKSWHI